MSSKVITYRFIFLIFVWASISFAQTSFTDLGISGGSSIVMVPTTSIAPSSGIRINAGRVEYLRSGLYGFNVFGFHSGLSSNLEAFVSLNSEQIGSVSSLVSYGLGGKLLLPFHVPVVGSVAFWGETISSPDQTRSGFIPHNATRFGVLSGPSAGKYNPIIFLGTIKTNNIYLPMVGLGVSYPFSSDVKLGTEGYYNYYGMREQQGLVTGVARIFSNISVQVGGGYLHSGTMSSWIFSAGLSIATSDFNMLPKPKTAPQTIVPSFEEMEKMSIQEKSIGESVAPPSSDQGDKVPDAQQENKDEKKDDPQR